MSRDDDREEQRLRDLLQGIQRGEDVEALDHDLLRPRFKKPNQKKKKKSELK